ncbi:hypothetical protein NBRC116583_34850 [Arenicella sp. 4NH20-0111]|uniref:metalloregulator ArsR/SmtB family transcription factor n=1 Tax=Arenicella sp. 4NH20-0111 TaxID=3127648 RepID=UPI00310413A7
MNQVEQTFSALGSNTRLAILEQLSKGETSLSDIAEPFEMSRTAAAKHVKIRYNPNLVDNHNRGRTCFCRGKITLNLSFLKPPQGETPVIVEAKFNLSAARLFQAWTIRSEIIQLFDSENGDPEIAEVDLKVSGDGQFVFPRNEGQTDSLAGKYLNTKQSELLEFSRPHTYVHVQLASSQHHPSRL